jgi:hypothetical protein
MKKNIGNNKTDIKKKKKTNGKKQKKKKKKEKKRLMQPLYRASHKPG